MTRRPVFGFAIWAVLLSALWLMLTGGSTSNWYIGVLAVVAGAALGVYLGRGGSGWSLKVGGALRFAPFFLLRSLSGGLDVAVRAVRPSLPLELEMVEFEFSIENHPARIFMVCVLGLLPGTLGARLEGDRLHIHSLVGGESALEGAVELESKVADLFGLDAPGSKGTGPSA
ncbi:Na+/H+ antiporter subunit E [Rubrobacter indicoceani]|uniref:Na+/H+ antiporter subunit E n=1 Tax=Rubrobacter indicoceani TaxID=2051957 RepID=UPI0013C4F34C|nr:Na+/H+ antiporter subunit E [Rubrobacter indicoceani]